MKLGRPILLVLCAAALAAAGCTKVEPGYAGVRVNLYGSQRGVSSLPLVTGRVWYNPLTEEIYQFPTFMQNVVWTRTASEGRPFDESFTANSREGVPFNFDVGVSYQMEADKVPSIFLKFREDAHTLTTVYVRNQVRDAFSIEASKMAIMDIVGPGKPHLLDAVQHDLETKLGPDGIHFDNVSIIGKTRLPEQVEVIDQLGDRGHPARAGGAEQGRPEHGRSRTARRRGQRHRSVGADQGQGAGRRESYPERIADPDAHPVRRLAAMERDAATDDRRRRDSDGSVARLQYEQAGAVDRERWCGCMAASAGSPPHAQG